MTVNLLPPNIKKEKEISKVLNLVYLFLTFIIILLISFIVSISIANTKLKNKISTNEKKISDQEASLKELDPIALKIKVINSKIDKISAVDKTRSIWSNIIKDLANDTPQRVQLSTLTLSGDDNKIELTGKAETRRDIAAFKDKLEESNYFKSVTFSTSSHNTQENSYSFNLSCELEKKK